MAKILHVDASPRSGRSLSRQLSRTFIQEWLATKPADPVITRDVGQDPPPHLSEAWIAAAFTSDDERTETQREMLSTSDDLVNEVLESDVLVIASPMYNYGMPSHLKAWVDHVIRIGRTFSFDLSRGEQPIEPIQTGKTLVMLVSSGEGYFAPGLKNAHRNHLDSHLAEALHLVGVSESYRVRIEFQEFNDDRHRRSVESAHAEARALARRLASEISV